MSFEEYIREKAAESRQKESIGFSFILLGMILLIGGLLMTHTTVGTDDWVLFIPWKRTSDPTSVISLSMTLSGFALIFAGAIYITFASSESGWYLRSLKDTVERTGQEEEEIFKQRLQKLRRRIKRLRDRS